MSGEMFALQAFTGLSVFSILMLMALGLAIVFGLMGVINMAHGELMAMGAYATYGTSVLFEAYFPSLMSIYFIVGVVLAFFATSVFGYFLERSLIQFLYKRPLDTMLATWGVGLILQQLYRQFINPRPVEVPTASWLQGVWQVSEDVSFPMSRIFIVGLAFLTATLVYLFLYRTRRGLLIRAVTQNRGMSGAIGINQKRVDAYTFALGCGLAGIAGSSFTMLASTAPDTGQAYIVDTFIVVVFGGVESLLGTIMSAFFIGQMQTWFEFYLSGSMARAGILLLVIAVLYFRPNGLFATKVRR
ncbi:MAG: urea ABC transporter permease subunit UrtB [Gammaproteobacteria bacterium]|nr:urea ABC transporter permease subunit UrtB [Gammaproteobacteria bacterium]MDH3465424.1 urea ABC transporter permease subunit UrtB [Gammaproteobacteria bacterium]